MKVMHLEIAFLVYLSTRNSQSSVWKFDSAAISEGWSEAKASIRKTKRTYGTRGKSRSFIKKSWCILRNIHHTLRTNCWKEINGKKEEGYLPRTYLWMLLNLKISDSDDSWMIKKRNNKMDRKKLGDCSLECYLQPMGIFPWWTGLPIKIVLLLSNHMIM